MYNHSSTRRPLVEPTNFLRIVKTFLLFQTETEL